MTSRRHDSSPSFSTDQLQLRHALSAKKYCHLANVPSSWVVGGLEGLKSLEGLTVDPPSEVPGCEQGCDWHRHGMNIFGRCITARNCPMWQETIPFPVTMPLVTDATCVHSWPHSMPMHSKGFAAASRDGSPKAQAFAGCAANPFGQIAISCACARGL